MSSQIQPKYTPQEYLALERTAQGKHEYLGGEIFAMGGASERHNLIVSNVIASLNVQLRAKPCKVYPSDMRVKVSPTGLYTYPDVVALCSQARFDDEQQDTLLNPDILIEVLSKSTEAYDRGEKSAHYRKIDSVKEYVLVSQDQRRLEHYVRQPNNHWLLSEVSQTNESLYLAAIGCTLSISDVYDKVDFAAG